MITNGILNRLRWVLVIVLSLILLPGVYADEKSWMNALGEEWEKRPEVANRENIRQIATIMVPMRDGTGLATDIYRNPIATSAQPAILIRTPYGRSNQAMISLAGVFAYNDYVCVIQDSRGTGDSEGDNWAFFDDGWGLYSERPNWDGYDTVEWVADQLWCNGKVGMLGASALGIAANLAAGADPPHLVCTAVQVEAADLYHDAAHTGGGFRKALVENWLDSVDAATEVLPLIREHEAYSELWQNASVLNRASSIDVPSYHVGGWFDIFSQGTLNFFSSLEKNGIPPAKGNQKLIMGPWTHVGEATLRQGELNFPANSIVVDEEAEYILEWFDYWLKEDGNDIIDLPAVRYYMMGDVDEQTAPGNEWRQASQWPVPSTTETLYLSAQGALIPTKPGGETQSAQFVYDPNDPVPTVGGPNLTIPAGPYDQDEVEQREDVLVFTSPVLTEPLEIVGRVVISLSVSTTAADTDWTAKLCDVYPDGRSMQFLDGLRRGRYAESYEVANFPDPGEVYSVEIDLGSTALAFNEGHRIRVSVSSSNSPRFEPNPNTGEPLAAQSEPVEATNTVYFSVGGGAQLLLPVVSPENHPLFDEKSTMWMTY